MGSPRDALVGADGGDWYLVRGRRAPRADGTVTFCGPAACDDPILVPRIQLVTTDPIVESLAALQTLFARTRDGQIVDLTYIVSDEQVRGP